jgi:hypothetical protein
VPSGAQPTHRPPLSAPTPPRPPAPTAGRADTDAAGSPRQTGGRARHPPPPDQPPAPRSPPARVLGSPADRGPWELPGHREGGLIPHGPAAQAAPPPPPPVGSLGSAPGRPPFSTPFRIYSRQPTVQRLPQQRPIETAKQSPKRFQGGDPVARKRQVWGPPIGMRPGPPPHAPQRN